MRGCPAENLVGELNGGWRVANGSLGSRTRHAVDRLRRPVGPADCRRHAHRTARTGLVRHARDGCLGDATARVRGPGSSRTRRRGCAGPVGAEAARLGGHPARRGRCARTPRAPTGLVHPAITRAVRTAEPGQLTTAAGSTGTRAASPAPSPAAPRRSSATSSPSGYWAAAQLPAPLWISRRP